MLSARSCCLSLRDENKSQGPAERAILWSIFTACYREIFCFDCVLVRLHRQTFPNREKLPLSEWERGSLPSRCLQPCVTRQQGNNGTEIPCPNSEGLHVYSLSLLHSHLVAHCKTTEEESERCFFPDTQTKERTLSSACTSFPLTCTPQFLTPC